MLEKRKARDDGQGVYCDRTLFPLPDGPLDLSSDELNRSDRQKFHQQFAKFKSSHLHKAGELVVRMHVAAKLGDDGSAPRLRLRIDDTLGVKFEAPIEGDCDVTVPIDKPQVCTFRIPFRHVTVGTTEENDEEETGQEKHGITLDYDVLEGVEPPDPNNLARVFQLKNSISGFANDPQR